MQAGSWKAMAEENLILSFLTKAGLCLTWELSHNGKSMPEVRWRGGKAAGQSVHKECGRQSVTGICCQWSADASELPQLIESTADMCIRVLWTWSSIFSLLSVMIQKSHTLSDGVDQEQCHIHLGQLLPCAKPDQLSCRRSTSADLTTSSC